MSLAATSQIRSMAKQVYLRTQSRALPPCVTMVYPPYTSLSVASVASLVVLDLPLPLQRHYWSGNWCRASE
jgi:hypothetical protein